PDRDALQDPDGVGAADHVQHAPPRRARAGRGGLSHAGKGRCAVRCRAEIASRRLTDYLPILVMLILATVFAAGSFLASTLLAPVIVAFAYVLSVGALDWGPARKLSEFAGRPILRASTWPPPPSGPDETSEAA